MPTLCKPAISVPEHLLTLEQTLELCRTLHADHPQLDLVLRLLRNTGVRTRHLVQPLDATLQHPGFEQRNRIYEAESKRRVPPTVRMALNQAGLDVKDIDAIVYVSCTGFLMPSMTAYLINEMGFRHDTHQIPIAQLGCAAGGAAISQAFNFCRAHPGSNVLIVACEFCSLCYQPDDTAVGNLLSNGLFGDAVACAVVRDEGGVGPCLERTASYLIPHTADWISYEVKASGFHFRLDKRVPGTMEPLAPSLRQLCAEHGLNASHLDFYIVHAGGPRILDDLCRFLDVDPVHFRHSRATLTEYGNIASAVVFDALRRAFEEGELDDGASGLIAGFGPGITAELCVGHWSDPRRRIA